MLLVRARRNAFCLEKADAAEMFDSALLSRESKESMNMIEWRVEVLPRNTRSRAFVVISSRLVRKIAV